VTQFKIGRAAPRPATVVVLVVGLLLTVVLTWSAARAHDNSNRSLLRLEVRQVAATLSTAISSFQAELGDAMTVATATRSPDAFTRFASARLPAEGFASESLWQLGVGGPSLLATAGTQPRLAQSGGAAAFFAKVRPGPSLWVTPVLAGSPPHLGYALEASGSGGLAVYVEAPLPADKKVAVPKGSPFGQLNYAVYLREGPASDLLEASLPTPVRGVQASATVPVGDATLVVVGKPRAELATGLSGELPWIVPVVGVTLSLVTAATLEYVARRRRFAEEMAETVGRLYSEQRSIATTLQHALLPQRLPSIPGLEIGARYIPGVVGVDVGGDWYDVIPVDDDRVAIVIGDVSGRGVQAASIMASLRFASRAYAMEGHAPSEVIGQLRRALDIGQDGHFATVLCGLVDVSRHEVTLASAGHLAPVIAAGPCAVVLDVRPSPPIGAPANGPAAAVTVTVEAGSTLVAYTDGLVERRGEGLADGIERLEKAIAHDSGSVDELLDHAITELTGGSPDDDVAMIGLRWLS
jgi:hypothetical protein